MSKLAHSDQASMDEIDARRAIENGDEDLLIEIQIRLTPHPLSNREPPQ